MAVEQFETCFDETWYIARYPDAAESVQTGRMRNAWHHFIEVGYDCGYDAFPFDEGWYLTKYSDIQTAVDEGAWPSAKTHFMRFGCAEGRQPTPGAKSDRVFAYGSFGTNNVEDEAILEGIRRLYPNCIQLYHQKRRGGEGYQPHQVLGNPDFFRPGDYLMLGGGGLLYDRATVVLMTNLAKAVIKAGGVVDIARLGCEAAHADYADAIVTLFSLARRVTLRSTISQTIIRDITGKSYPVEFDFAFNLTREVRLISRRLSPTPTIGIVTATSTEADLKGLAAMMRRYTRAGMKQPIRFVYIPHSRSYFDGRNNDCVSAELLWSLMSVHEAASEDLFELRPFDPDPLSVLALYRQLDGVISSRYHGLIFGRMADIPTLALGGGLVKLRSFIDDHPSDDLMAAKDMGELAPKMVPFVEKISARRGPGSGAEAVREAAD